MPPKARGRGNVGWFTRVSEFKLEDLFARKREPGPPRTIYVNQSLPKDEKEIPHATNQVITSKYTVITFLPRSLLEQFRRVANLFFLLIAILQFFSLFETINPAVSVAPLVVILFITALKDGYEDIKRHQSDRHINYSTIRVLRGGDWVNENKMMPKKGFLRRLLPSTGGPPSKEPLDVEAAGDADSMNSAHITNNRPHWHRAYWEDLRVGDLVKIMDNEAVPADILICATSEDENVTFVETKNLDGETNLKSRNAVPALTHLRNAVSCADRKSAFSVYCDRPDTDMYRLNGTVTVDGEVASMDLSMSLLRGMVVRNTGWVVGVVLFTGFDTKVVLNSGETPSKRSKVERQMNIMVFVNLVILAAMALTCGVANSSLEKIYYPEGALWLFGDNTSDNNPQINGLITAVFSLLTFQIIVPISLYISIEFVKTLQAAWIYLDGEIWYQKTDQPAIARSWNLSDDLGQIEYIFSDKTGTLTQNSMVFRQCSIGGKAYRGETTAPTTTPENTKKVTDSDEDTPAQSSSSRDVEAQQPQQPTEQQQPVPLTTKTSISSSDTQQSEEEHTRFEDWSLLEDLKLAENAEPGSEAASHARSLNGFFTVLALCHTALASINPTTNEIQYKAQSPDELALVRAAAEVGFVFTGRDRDVLTLKTPFGQTPERYKLLNVLEFTSARKRMSVIVRKLDDQDPRLLLLSKGADNVIFGRLRNAGGAGGEELKEVTEQHLSEFARSGLRTLTLAYKVLREDEYEAWSRRYYEATIAMEEREEKIEAVSDEIEQQLRLLGATAIEDRLQDGVPETIADLKAAGIKVWVATGDKMETAIAIGRSTNLINEDSNIIVLRGTTDGKPVIDQMKDALEMFFGDTQTIPDKRRASTDDGSGGRGNGLPLKRLNTGLSSIVGPKNGERPGGFILVVDGAALLEAFATDEGQDYLLHLGTSCEGVICCRVSPLQKALVVKLVKDGLDVMTLAIGDGANDVSMIQSADVGVGISGEEGLQAVNSSDYAIAQFRFLKKLLLVHGHWSYSRNSIMILNFWYKNIVPVGVLWWFQIYEFWSANYVFEYTYILLWNTVFTVAPVVGIGLFDRFAESHVLMDYPQLYRYGRENTWFGLRSFALYMFDGIAQSALIFFIITYAYFTTSTRPDGWIVSQYEFSTAIALMAATITNIAIGVSATAWTGWIFFAVFIGLIAAWIFTPVYSAIPPSDADSLLYGDDFLLFHSAVFWFAVIFVLIVAVMPRIIAKAWRIGFNPDDINIIRYAVKKGTYHKPTPEDRVDSSLAGLRRPALLSRTTSRAESIASAIHAAQQLTQQEANASSNPRSASRTDMSTGRTTMHDHGFDFSMEERGVAMNQLQRSLTQIRESVDGGAVDGQQQQHASRGSKFSLRRGIFAKKTSERPKS
ncbi:phospholipid-translocating P-type ATPase [Pluteus cervinus]|uniref:Phospholipid-translocating P-type ATPase n=1 Tax=Pluteus cervinus TaxID=181527 RepID=A0ACD3ACP8_9AGAR|nr:phospholipid-translocating P-type ATPase [Pluteus cervinus]